MDYGSTVLYRKYIHPPCSSAHAMLHTAEYKLAGFPGAIGSCDATHIMLERVSYRFRQTHLGHKMKHTARTYNITVNHRRQIIATTGGHPARWNDKTLALFDDFMQALRQGTIMDDMIFELYAYDTAGEIIKQKYRGARVMPDGRLPVLTCALYGLFASITMIERAFLPFLICSTARSRRVRLVTCVVVPFLSPLARMSARVIPMLSLDSQTMTLLSLLRQCKDGFNTSNTFALRCCTCPPQYRDQQMRQCH